MKTLRKPHLSIFLALLILFTSCSGEELINKNDFEDFNNMQYNEMIVDLKKKIETVISETKPKNLTIQDYKIKLLNGEMSMSKSQEIRILEASERLNDYGKYLARKNNIEIDTNAPGAALALGGLYSPEDDLHAKYEIIKTVQGDDVQARIDHPVLRCGVIAIGADALWALGGSSASAWSAAAMTRAFAAVAKRFLGPIGVAIAVVTFAVCMSSE